MVGDFGMPATRLASGLAALPSPAVRIAIFDALYADVLKRLYERDPGLAQRPYDDQLAAILDLSFGTSDAYSIGLRELGHEVVDVIRNWPPLQIAWARENGAAPALRRIAPRVPHLPGRVLSERLLHAVARAQIEAFDPRVVYLQDFWFFSKRELLRLKGEGRYVVAQLGSRPPEDGRVEVC